MSNHLKDQSSPYLLQHAENPVEWYPWSDEAFEKAMREDKPIFLSIGYSTCHWCHVMAHESFENAEIAEILNKYFVSVKVDREERPDIDSVYMTVCQALTGSGGWPMSIFMTADQKPFFAGTYFPPISRNGMTGFGDLLLVIADAWKEKRDELLESAKHLIEYVNAKMKTKMKANVNINKNDEDGAQMETGADGFAINYDLPERAAQIFDRSFDRVHGGFGQAPKFPTPHHLLFLMLYSEMTGRTAAFEQAKITLEQMRRGGIFDHIGYGFSRYSTDARYLVPHFEKMLYDNALLMMAYTAGFKMSGSRFFLDTAEQTADYILREMTGRDGEFYSAQDADSEGVEGKFYVWDYEEICSILGREKGENFCRHFGITKQGNFGGSNIPNLLNLMNGNAASRTFEQERKLLYDYRRKRMALHLDDKILTSWNAWMICAMSMLYRATGRECYLLAAENCHKFIEEHLTDGDILYVSCRNQVRLVKGFLDEYACYSAALISLYEATSKTAYLERAKQICGEAMRQFGDDEGGYFLYGKENSPLLMRPKETYDGALPSGNSVMAYVLVRLSQLTDGERFLNRQYYDQMARRQLAFMSESAADDPAGYCMFLIALLMYEYPPQQIKVVPARGDTAANILPGLPLYADIQIIPEGTEEYHLLDGKTTYYVCKHHACLPPTNKVP